MGHNAQTHATFLARLEASEPARVLVAETYRRYGWHVEMVPLTKAATHDDWPRHSDNGDLYIDGRRVEVKRLQKRTFTGSHDWPYRPNFIVDGKPTWDRKYPKPYFYLCLNPEMTAAARLWGSTRPYWRAEMRRDGDMNLVKEFYVVDYDFAVFGTVEQFASMRDIDLAEAA